MLIKAAHLGAAQAGRGTEGSLTIADLLPPGLVARLDGLDVRSQRVFSGKLQGERRSKRRGRSVEFDDFRPYVAGDDLRHIDWNVYARFDRFFIKLFQAEEDLTVHVVLDASASMLAGTPSKLLTGARLAAAASYAALVNNNRLVLSAIGLPESDEPGLTVSGLGGVRRLEPVRGRTSVQRAAGFLLSVAQASASAPLGVGAGRATDFGEGVRSVASSRAGRGVMVLISDLLIPGAAGKGKGEAAEPGYAPGLRYLAESESYQSFVFQVLSPGELDPAAETGAGRRSPVWGDLRLLDVETGAGREVTVTAELLRRYRDSAARFVKDASAWCRARGIEHAMITSDRDVESGLVDALREAGVLA